MINDFVEFYTKSGQKCNKGVTGSHLRAIKHPSMPLYMKSPYNRMWMVKDIEDCRKMGRRHYFIGLLIVLVIALIARSLLLMSGAVSFHSDEAIVALMGRHITLGERPVFFYGQAYMGSLDAWVLALGFQLFGESVNTIRLMQSILFIGVVATAYHAAWVLSRRIAVAVGSGLLFAIGPVLLALYTTATLGGYNETLIFGHLIVAIGYTVVSGKAASHQPLTTFLWLLLGIITGLAWWTNALIVIYVVPVALFMLVQVLRSRSRRMWILVGVALIGFFIGSAPWWLYALQNEWGPLRFLLPTGLRGDNVGAELQEIPFTDRLIGLLLFGLPSLLGLRFPWEAAFFLPVIGLVVLGIVLIGVYRLVRARNTLLQPGALWILLGMIALMIAVFLFTRFSSDPSGRYFLPLTLPLVIAVSSLTAATSTAQTRSYLARGAGLAAVGLTLLYFAAGQIVAARGPYGLTTQFNTETHLPAADDAALIDWLLTNDLRYGYTNYWINFRIAFLSREQIQLSAALPDKSNLLYTPVFDRYPPYRQASDSAERVAYITALIPEIDAAMESWLAAEAITYQTQQIGIYRVYYDFAPRVPRPPVPFARQ